MMPAKRHLLEDSCPEARPTKRLAQPITDITDRAPCIQGCSESSDTSSERLAQSPPSSLPNPNGSELSSTPASVDEVCFGMVMKSSVHHATAVTKALQICGIKTQFLDDPSIATIQHGPDGSTNNYHNLYISMNQHHMLHTNGGKKICILNTRTSQALQKLDCLSQLRYSVYVAADEWTAKIRSFKTLGKSVCLDINIQFFGSPTNSTFVGSVLSNTGHFLQQPDFLDNSIPYDNPHEIVFPDVGLSGSSSKLPTPESTSINDFAVDMTNTLLDNLDNTGSLTVRHADSNVITTKLKPHQNEALDFIAQREAPYTSAPFSLFKQCIDPRNGTYYEHSILGTRKPEKQPENFGGIIADEMGLGKTLTMISVIAMTTKQARQFQDNDIGSLTILDNRKRAKATLVICPAVLLMDGWLEEVSNHIVPGFLKCTKYHGGSKATNTEILESDIVLTTYATLIADSSRNSILHGIHWFRIIIDEGHFIRHQRTKQFHAVASLSAKYRWCLTGTPIQNTLNDLGALVRFLRVPQLDGSSDFYSRIAQPIEKRSAEGLRRLRELLRCICLRRTKNLLKFPKPYSYVELVILTAEERYHYCRIGKDHRQAIDQAISRGNLSEASSGLFCAILRLRQYCNSGICVDSDQISSSNDESPFSLESGNEAVCSYCSCDVYRADDKESASSSVILSCSHHLCSECIDRCEYTDITQICCVVCGTFCSAPKLQQERLLICDESPSRLTGHSSKLDALVRNVAKHQGEKCIIFSSWKNSSRLTASYLAAHNIQVCVVDGSMTLPKRRSILQHFQQSPTVTALVMTLGTGAVGLNLTVASYVHILEPQWNPFIEKQAIGRVTRIGQEKPVTVVRYVAEHTIEQHIQTKQEKKMHFAQLGWEETTVSDETRFKKLIAMKSLLSYDSSVD